MPSLTSLPGRHRRRTLLAGISSLVFGFLSGKARALTIAGALPWTPGAAAPPAEARLGPWLFFTPAEARATEALVDRLIPPDEKTPGGKDAGCAVFIDRQLAGPYGNAHGLYMQGPFAAGTPEQGDQSPFTPAMRYRRALAALDRLSRQRFAGKPFAAIPPSEQDALLAGLESGAVALEDLDGKAFFALLLENTKEGFFADPVYGGNRGMASWTMIGFPGARYDYRDWISRHNERYPLPPVGIMGRPAWNEARG
ncbi:MAG TPA: gluconate 2-dehydrogenase subunit 3 family protein [Acetobacteraceae bacterium]|nr:gluconate 2-dehydrogenase subunit 3 family protein [Acetobacteraceae bacterium]